MFRFSLPFKVGILMTLAAALVSAAGYLTFKSLSSIVSSIQVKSRPDLRLLMIRDISADLYKAEYSVRLYRLSRNQRDIMPYYAIIGEIDGKIDSLALSSGDDKVFTAQIDTISGLIEENMLVWNEMIDLYHTDSLDIYIRTVTAKIAVGSLNKKTSEKSILKKVFSRKALKEQAEQEEKEAQQAIISDLHRIEKQDSLRKTMLLNTESKLALTGNEIRERLYNLISRMEYEVITSIKNKSKAAEQLADKTYQWLLLFALLVTLLVITVLIVVVRFVRKTREYNAALERSKEETEQLAKTKELFVANMSHEIRTPVNAIFGFTEQLIHEPLNAKSRKMLGIIRSTSDHLVQVVNDILDYSKLQNAKIELEKKHFLLQPLFEEVVSLFIKNASVNNTRLYYSISSMTPHVLFGDAHRLKQILLNLIGNAVKFTSNGEIYLSAEVENMAGHEFNLKIAVIDNGIGISEKMKNLVFEDFTQAEAGTSRKYGGTGLGLSIVKKLVDLHQGVIKLDSEEGKGTTLTCILPYQSGSKSQITIKSDVPVIPEIVRNKKILIVDDESYNRMLFKTIFTRWQVIFEEVDDGFKALEMIKSNHYDMVFMDARMPGIDGLEAAQHIRKDFAISADTLPIIGTSATHNKEDMQMYLSAGMNAFLPKPFTEKMLLDAILSVLPVKERSVKKHLLPDSRISYVDEKIAVDTVTASEMFQGNGTEADTSVNLSNIYHLANNDITFVKQLITSFIESTDKGIQSLQDAVHSKDINAIYEIAHRISSPCRHLGANNLYSNLKMMEEQAKNNKNIGILAKLTTQSKKDFLEIKEGLQKHLERI